MTTRATSPFDVQGWTPTPYEEDVPGPKLLRVKFGKVFRGDLTAESTAELLMCVAASGNPAEGAGYVVSERVTGTLGGRAGSFVLQHWGIGGSGVPQRAEGHVVPGSGTGELAGLLGKMEISLDHVLTLDYEISPT